MKYSKIKGGLVIRLVLLFLFNYKGDMNMAKQKQQKRKPQKKEDDRLTLQDSLNQDILSKLKQAQQDLKAEEESRKLQEEERKREERRQREKNKSFEELLNESSMDWQKYK